MVWVQNVITLAYCDYKVEKTRHFLPLPLDARKLKGFQLQGASPPDPPTRGSAPGPRWGLCPQTPVIGSLPLAMTPAFRFLFLYDWSPAPYGCLADLEGSADHSLRTAALSALSGRVEKTLSTRLVN